jgi:hypothetical protein
MGRDDEVEVGHAERLELLDDLGPGDAGVDEHRLATAADQDGVTLPDVEHVDEHLACERREGDDEGRPGHDPPGECPEQLTTRHGDPLSTP